MVEVYLGGGGGGQAPPPKPPHQYASGYLYTLQQNSDKSEISCKEQKCPSFPLTSMEYHDVLPYISLSRMSVYA